MLVISQNIMSYIAIVLSSTIPIEFWNRMIILCFLFISNKYAGGKLMLANKWCGKFVFIFVRIIGNSDLTLNKNRPLTLSSSGQNNCQISIRLSLELYHAHIHL